MMSPREALDELAYLLREAIMLEPVPDFVAPLITDFLISGELQHAGVYDSPSHALLEPPYLDECPILVELVRHMWMLSPPLYVGPEELVDKMYVYRIPRDGPGIREAIEHKKNRLQAPQQHNDDARLHNARAD